MRRANVGSTLMSFLARVLALAVVALAFAGTAQAADGYVYESSIRLPQGRVSPGNPGQAIFKSDVRFTTIESVCIHVWFDPADPLDPGEELRFTPNSWLEADPFARGPGLTNTTQSAQTFRTLCVTNYPGQPLDPFIAAFLDGRQVLKLHSSGGSVRIDRIDVEIVGSTA